MGSILTEREPEQDQQEKGKNEFYKFLRLLPLAVLGVFLNAYLLLLSWHWFVVPLGAREITFWHSAGLSTVISYLGSSYRKSLDDEVQGYDYWAKLVLSNYKQKAFYFVLIWVCHLLMKH